MKVSFNVADGFDPSAAEDDVFVEHNHRLSGCDRGLRLVEGDFQIAFDSEGRHCGPGVVVVADFGRAAEAGFACISQAITEQIHLVGDQASLEQILLGAEGDEIGLGFDVDDVDRISQRHRHPFAGQS